MLIDCRYCSARGAGCSDCVIAVLLGAPDEDVSGEVVDFDDAERSAVAALSDGGLIPPLRLLPVVSFRSTDSQQSATQASDRRHTA